MLLIGPPFVTSINIIPVDMMMSMGFNSFLLYRDEPRHCACLAHATQLLKSRADSLSDLHFKSYKGSGHEKLPTKHGLRDLWELPMIKEMWVACSGDVGPQVV